MSIPRAKITQVGAGFQLWDAACQDKSCAWYCRGHYLWDDAANSAREHLRAHGVRTVGSLTADDIGKWIEVEGDELDLDILGKIVSIEHMSGDHSAMTLMEDLLGDIYDVEFPSSTPCRVPEERP